MLTIHEAAHQLLRDDGNPLPAKELARRALAKGLVHSSALSPVDSLAQTIEKNVREGIYNRPELAFVQTAAGRYIGLPHWNGAQPGGACMLRVFETNYLPTLGTGVVVVTGDVSENGDIFAECSVILPRDRCHYYYQRFRHSPTAELGLDQATVLDCVRDHARVQVQNRADELYLADPRYGQIPVISLRECDKNALLSMWLRGECTDRLRQLMSDTRSPSLRNYLHSMQALRIEKVV